MGRLAVLTVEVILMSEFHWKRAAFVDSYRAEPATCAHFRHVRRVVRFRASSWETRQDLMALKLAGTRFFGTLIGGVVLITTTMVSFGHAQTQEAVSGARTPDVDTAWLGAILTNPSIPTDLRAGAAER